VKGGSYEQRRPPAPPTAEAASRLLRTDLLDRPEMAILQPEVIGANLWREYPADSTINRTINQVVEQATGDGHARPTIDYQPVRDALIGWWKQERFDLRIRPTFKEYLLSGEQWHYVPLRKDGRIRLRSLVPWGIFQIVGHDWTDWESASYRFGNQEIANLTPLNTAFFAHDALFSSLRGLTPFATMAFGARRYRRFLDGRERVNRLAGTVTGEFNFENLADAAAVLGWPLDDQGIPQPKTVYLPEEGTVAVTIGASKFQLMAPSVNAGGADPDAQRFYLRLIEGGRLPEYASGNGANVNVATATVQYPFAVRFILSMRDEFEYAMTESLRLVLTRMAALGMIPTTWTATRADGTTEVETPQTATITWSFPEIRELDFQAHFDSVLALIEKNLLADERAMEMLGYDPETDMPSPEEREARRAATLGMLQQVGQNAGAQPGDDATNAGLEGIGQAVRTALMDMLAEQRRAPTE